MIEIKSQASRVEKSSLKLDSKQLVFLLQVAGHNIPDGTEFTVKVPGGGDWSNTELRVGADATLLASWETETPVERDVKSLFEGGSLSHVGKKIACDLVDTNNASVFREWVSKGYPRLEIARLLLRVAMATWEAEQSVQSNAAL